MTADGHQILKYEENNYFDGQNIYKPNDASVINTSHKVHVVKYIQDLEINSWKHVTKELKVLKTALTLDNKVSKRQNSENHVDFQTDLDQLEESKNTGSDYLDEFFGPQIPLPGEEHFMSIDTSDNLNSNCTQMNSSDPCTENLEHAPVFEQKTLVKVIILSAIALFAFFGNIATLTSIVVSGRQSTSTVYILLVQLAIADLLVAIFCLMADAIWKVTVQWYGGNILCKFVKFMQMLSLYLSTYILVLIGFDRLCAVRFPMGRSRAKYYIRNGILCIWMLSALFSLPQAFIFSVMKGPFIEEFYQCVTFGFYTAPWQEQLYTTLSLVLMFLLPLIILIVTYIATFSTIASQENMFTDCLTRSPVEDARQKILRKAKIKTLMITVVIVLTFVICWTPYYVTMIIFIFLEPDEELSQNLQAFVFFFGSSTSMINPLIYGAFHLRGRKPKNSKSTTYINNSSSSRVDISLAVFHK